jgi:hypothetical protein
MVISGTSECNWSCLIYSSVHYFHLTQRDACRYVTAASVNSLFWYIRGRVSLLVRNGSKTTVIDVVGFLCVPLGSNTVQLHDRLNSKRACTCSEAGFSSQNGDGALRSSYQRIAIYCAFFSGKKDSMQVIFK